MINEKNDWWKQYFTNEGYVKIEGFVWNVKGSVDFIVKEFNLPLKSRILDLACGYGRISIELALRGYDVVGLDYSGDYLDIGRSEAVKRGAVVQFVQGDMREIKNEDEFDAVVCWCNSFGYFSEEENQRVIHYVSRALKPEGKLMLDLHNKDSVIRNHLGKRWFKENNFYNLLDWQFDARSSRSIINWTVINEDNGEIEKWVNDYREYTLQELKWMLGDAGLEFVEVYGDSVEGFTRGGFGLDSSLIVLAKKTRSNAYL